MMGQESSGKTLDVIIYFDNYLPSFKQPLYPCLRVEQTIQVRICVLGSPLSCLKEHPQFGAGYPKKRLTGNNRAPFAPLDLEPQRLVTEQTGSLRAQALGSIGVTRSYKRLTYLQPVQRIFNRPIVTQHRRTISTDYFVHLPTSFHLK